MSASNVSVFVLLVVSGNLSYGYDYYGQSKWFDEFENCNNNKQSPIELTVGESQIFLGFSELKFINYRQQYSAPVLLSNDNHTVGIEIPTSAKSRESEVLKFWRKYDNGLPQISGGPLGFVRYVAESIHFHWGSTDSHGSEHVLNGKRNSLEMHILHRNMKYKSVRAARGFQDGLSVLAVLFQAAPGNRDNPGLLPVTNALNQIVAAESSVHINEKFSLTGLLDKLNLGEYFTYDGSVTSPPCFQTVKWIVLTTIVPVSTQQLAAFRKIRDSNGDIIENNYRNLQPRGDRIVYLRRNKMKTFLDLLNGY